MAKTKIRYGIVESIDDPTCQGRIKVRIEGHNDNIPVEQLPWCSFGGSNIFSGNGAGAISIARVGQRVRLKFKGSDTNPDDYEWLGPTTMDPDLIEEIKDDYEGTQILLYDSSQDLSIKYQQNSGLLIYLAGSFIQITPDAKITIHYGMGASGTQIQLSEGRVDIQGSNEINLTSSGTINLEADNIVLNAKQSIQMKGSTAGECAINGSKLMSALIMLANTIDGKVPQTAGITGQYLNAMKEGIMNQNIQYI